MGFTVLAVVAGIALGLLFGGRFANLTGRTLRAWPLLPAGAVLQALPEVIDLQVGFFLVVLSYLLLLAFAVANMHLVGMPVVLIGLALNITVMAANAGMPVRADAIVAAGIAEADEVASLDYGAKRHLEDDDTRLAWLGDIVPVPGIAEVLSFGDLVMMFGVADLVARLLRPVRRARRTVPPSAALTVAPAAPSQPREALVDLVAVERRRTMGHKVLVESS